MPALALRDATGSAFELDLTGFEPPQRRWLIVRMVVTGPAGRRMVTEPCLMARDVRSLARWFDGLAKGRRRRALDFLEPTLAFGVVASTAESLAIRVRVTIHPDDVSEVVIRSSRSDLEGVADRLRRRLDELDV
jgi:hypothetical protein